MCDHQWLDVLLPHLAGVVVEQVEQAGSGVQVWARVKAEDGVCPACGRDTAASPAVYYTVPRPKHKGKEPIALCTHQPAEVEEARKCLGV